MITTLFWRVSVRLFQRNAPVSWLNGRAHTWIVERYMMCLYREGLRRRGVR